MSKSCKYCNKSGLSWNFNILSKKWELLESNGSRHRCMVLPKPKQKSPNNPPKIDIRNDPKINKALEIFKEKLRKQKPAREYFLKRV